VAVDTRLVAVTVMFTKRGTLSDVSGVNTSVVAFSVEVDVFNRLSSTCQTKSTLVPEAMAAVRVYGAPYVTMSAGSTNSMSSMTSSTTIGKELGEEVHLLATLPTTSKVPASGRW
jgi:hypothetical protein